MNFWIIALCVFLALCVLTGLFWTLRILLAERRYRRAMNRAADKVLFQEVKRG